MPSIGQFPPVATLLGVFNATTPEVCRLLAEHFDQLAAEARRAASELEGRAAARDRAELAGQDWRQRAAGARAVLAVRLATMPPDAAVAAVARETGISRQYLDAAAVALAKQQRAAEKAARDRRIARRAARGWRDREIAAAEGISARQVSRIVASVRDAPRTPEFSSLAAE